MAWEIRGDRRYYTRSRKVHGRVVREYVGTGAVAEFVAVADALRRADRRADVEARRTAQARWQAALTPSLVLSRAIDLLTRATLLAAGYRQHARCCWRKK